MYWLTICVLVCFTTWLLVVQPVRSAKRAAKVTAVFVLVSVFQVIWTSLSSLKLVPSKRMYEKVQAVPSQNLTNRGPSLNKSA